MILLGLPEGPIVCIQDNSINLRPIDLLFLSLQRLTSKAHLIWTISKDTQCVCRAKGLLCRVGSKRPISSKKVRVGDATTAVILQPHCFGEIVIHRVVTVARMCPDSTHITDNGRTEGAHAVTDRRIGCGCVAALGAVRLGQQPLRGEVLVALKRSLTRPKSAKAEISD